MAIAFDSASGANPGGGTSTTLSHTCSGTNRILFVFLRFYKSGAGISYNPSPSVTYNGVAMSLAGSRFNALTDQAAYIYYLINPASGTNNIVANFSSTDDVAIRSQSYTGALQSGVPNAFSTGPLTNSALTISVTTTLDNCWLVGQFTGANGNRIDPSTGSTKRSPSYNAADIGVDSNGPQTPAGIYSMRCTTGVGEPMYGMILAFAPSIDTSKSFFQLF